MANTRSQVIARDFKCARNYLTLLEKAEADSDTRPNKTEEEQKIQGLIHEVFSLVAVSRIYPAIYSSSSLDREAERTTDRRS
jgi:hypothetical protein